MHRLCIDFALHPYHSRNNQVLLVMWGFLLVFSGGGEGGGGRGRMCLFLCSSSAIKRKTSRYSVRISVPAHRVGVSPLHLLDQGWAIIVSMGPHEKQKILWRAGPKCLTQFCIILIVFLYKKQ